MAKQSRKSNQNRRRRRRARRGGAPTVLVLLCILVAVMAVITAMTIFFKVQTFTLTGQTRYSKEELVAASGIEQGDNLILFDKFGAIDRIFDACPYLDTVQMRRRYPDRIEIIVTECVPIAMLDDLPGTMPDPEDDEKTVPVGGTGWWLMDKDGKLLERVHSTSHPELTRITGLTMVKPEIGQKAKFLQQDVQKPLFLLLNTAKDDGILQDIGGVDFSQQYDIRFDYLGRFRVKLGSTEDLEKNSAACTILPRTNWAATSGAHWMSRTSPSPRRHDSYQRLNDVDIMEGTPWALRLNMAPILLWRSE